MAGEGERERQTQAGLSEEVPEVQPRDKVTASWFLEEMKKTVTWPASYQPSAPTWLSYTRLPRDPVPDPIHP